MKFASLVIAVLCSFSLLQAQETVSASRDKKTVKNNEIGLMSDFSIGNSDQSITMVGLQYKHWNNKTLAYRVSVGSGKYFDRGTERFLPSGSTDSVYSRRVNYHLPMAFLAIGIEVQREFYHKLFFYGALELKGGYGNGYYDSVYSKTSVYNNGGYVDAGYRSNKGNDYYAAFSPAFGLKLNFKRLVIGTEFTSLMQFVSREANKSRSGDLYFDLSNFNQRVYINYRFR